MVNDNIKNLIRNSQNGCKDSFCDFVDQKQSIVKGFVARYIFGPDDVFDLSQEVFLIAFKKINSFNADDNPDPWLRTIARNVCLNYNRNEARRHKHEKNAIQEKLIQQSTKEITGSQHGLDAGLLQMLDECMENIKGFHKNFYEILNFRYLKNLTTEQISKLVGKKTSTTRVSLKRARDMLKDCMARKLEAENV